MRDYFSLMAGYNAWANTRLLEACEALPAGAFTADRGGFFGSIAGTLNHLLVTDRIWTARLTGTPLPPYGLDTLLFDDLAQLRAARTVEDANLAAYVAGLTDEACAAQFRWVRKADGVEVVGPLWKTLAHLFNHQTHHRGQAHDLIGQAGVAPPSLDLPVYQREAGV
ncbi:DinB family protein [Caulobacter endophyticus]|uniref:DinB family protein n=1 Tax=Caulobacter endophyticus TaxID=2172652 RepID=UPI002410A2C2|nr:DinB family protein [Caulobacter endophyticus]MDG2530386.1 DinB family protein [Caulobacter endophyticus]